jgi:hypothetical protein
MHSVENSLWNRLWTYRLEKEILLCPTMILAVMEVTFSSFLTLNVREHSASRSCCLYLLRNGCQCHVSTWLVGTGIVQKIFPFLTDF